MSSVLTRKKIPLALFLLCCIGLIFMGFTPAPVNVQTAGWHSFAILPIVSLASLVISAGVSALWRKLLGL